MLVVTGRSTTIIGELEKLIPPGETVSRAGGVLECLEVGAICAGLPFSAERFVLAAGCLPQKTVIQHEEIEVRETVAVNLVSPVVLCEAILAANKAARICVIGSESGYRGSHNMLYAAAKAGLHGYVESKPLGPKQQLVCVAPTIIEDSGMTGRRKDAANLDRRRVESPKRRFVTAAEVARTIYWLLYEDRGFVTNTVIRMDGRTR